VTSMLAHSVVMPRISPTGVQPLRVAVVTSILLLHHLALASADVDEQLMYAVVHGNRQEALDLIGYRGANVNSRDEGNSTPLYFAVAREEMADVVRLLVKRGADVNARCKGGFTPLHQACLFGAVGNVRILLDAGADTRARETSRNDTALHVAILSTACTEPVRLRIVDLLISKGADISAKDKEQMSPLDLANERHLDQVMKLMKQADAEKKRTEGEKRAKG
jgi:ankyrin repeat protein